MYKREHFPAVSGLCKCKAGPLMSCCSGSSSADAKRLFQSCIRPGIRQELCGCDEVLSGNHFHISGWDAGIGEHMAAGIASAFCLASGMYVRLDVVEDREFVAIWQEPSEDFSGDLIHVAFPVP